MPEDGLSQAIPLDDYLSVIPQKRFKPRIIGLKLGRTLFLGGFARIDYVSGPSFVNLSVFAVPELALVQLPTAEADEEFTRTISEPIMAPFQNREGQRVVRKPRPGLNVKEVFRINCDQGYNRASADIVFPGLGWVAVAANKPVEFTCHYLPGCSISQRQPMMPYDMGKKPY